MKSVSGKRLGRLLELRGWSLQRVTGSHHIYTKAGSEVRITVPVHPQLTNGSRGRFQLMLLSLRGNPVHPGFEGGTCFQQFVEG